MTESNPINPYQAPAIEDLGSAAVRKSTIVSTTDASLPKTIGVWTIVCTISAAPGFYWGTGVARGPAMFGMVLGILIFIAIYVFGDFQTRHLKWRREPRVRRTLLIGYWTRMIVSIIFPVGLTIDLLAGMIAVPLSGGEISQTSEFWRVLQVTWTTLVTGVVINIFVFAYMLCVYVVLYCFWKPKAKPVEFEETRYS